MFFSTRVSKTLNTSSYVILFYLLISYEYNCDYFTSDGCISTAPKVVNHANMQTLIKDAIVND